MVCIPVGIRVLTIAKMPHCYRCVVFVESFLHVGVGDVLLDSLMSQGHEATFGGHAGCCHHSSANEGVVSIRARTKWRGGGGGVEAFGAAAATVDVDGFPEVLQGAGEGVCGSGVDWERLYGVRWYVEVVL